MLGTDKPGSLPYLVIVGRHNATEVLLKTERSMLSLPSLVISSKERRAPELVAAIRQELGIETYCLWTSDSIHSTKDTTRRFAVMEALGACDRLSVGTVWTSHHAALSGDNFVPKDQAALRAALEDLARYRAKTKQAPFGRPEWLEELLGWVEQEIRPRKLSGRFRQLTASPTFSLLRIETTGTPVWFKATGEPLSHERTLTVTLERLFPEFLPRIVSVHSDWNGWLSEEVAGHTLDDSADVRDWAKAAESLARLQIASIAHAGKLQQNGCKKLDLTDLASEITPFVDRMHRLMAAQTRRPPEILSETELAYLGDALRIACGDLEKFGWPEALGHLDPNPHNLIVTPDGCRFLDWAEGSIVHPLITFEYLCEHARRTFGDSETPARKLRDAFVALWQSLISSESLERSFVISPLLAVYACAVADKRWRSAKPLEDSRLAGYFRSLTRRAYHEARYLETRSHRCLTP
jgi:hypothetical protein